MGITNSNKVINQERIDCDGSLRVTLALTAAPDIITNPTDIALVLQNRLFLQRVQPFPERPARQPAARQRHCQRECKDRRVHGCTLHKVTSCGFPVV